MAPPKEKEREGGSSQSGRGRPALALACEKKGIFKLCRIFTYNYLKPLKTVFYNLKIIKLFQYIIQLTARPNHVFRQRKNRIKKPYFYRAVEITQPNI